MRWGIALVAFAVVAFGTEASASVNLPVGNIPRWGAKDISQRKQVFVYYANTPPNNSWAMNNRTTLLNWLNDIPVDMSAKIAAKIKEDLMLFSAAVEKEMQNLQKGLLSTSLGQSTGAVWITNALVDRNTILVLEPGGSEVRQEPLFAFPRSDDPRLLSAPLMDVQFLKAFFSWTKRRFEPQNPLYSMVIKSHGAPDYLMTQLVSLRTNAVSKERFREEVLFEDRLVQEGKPFPDESAHPKLEKTVGMLKSDFFNLLAHAADAPHFSVLFLESCKSGEGLGHIHALPSTVDLLYTSDHSGLKYETLDYSKVMASTDGKNFAKGFQTTLETLAKENLKKRRALSAAWLKQITLALPLTVLLALGVRSVWRRRTSIFRALGDR